MAGQQKKFEIVVPFAMKRQTIRGIHISICPCEEEAAASSGSTRL